MRRQSKQRGLSLIETMIGLLLGGIIIVMVTEVFNANKTSQNRIMSQARLQENARYALLFISRQVRLAGMRSVPEEIPQYTYRNYSSPLINAVDGSASASSVFSTRTQTIMVNNTNVSLPNVAALSDVLVLSYQSPDTETKDCLGNGVDPRDIVANIYYARIGDLGDDKGSRFALFCRTYHMSPNGLGGFDEPVSPQGGSLVEDITGFQVTLGQDVTLNGVPDNYFTPSNVTNFDDVVSVQVQISVKGGKLLDLIETGGSSTYGATEALTATFSTNIVNRNQKP